MGYTATYKWDIPLHISGIYRYHRAIGFRSLGKPGSNDQAKCAIPYSAEYSRALNPFAKPPRCECLKRVLAF